MEGVFSEQRPMLAGVPQGSVLSPVLYNIYKADVPKSLSTQFAIYADVICIYDKIKIHILAHRTVQNHLNDKLQNL